MLNRILIVWIVYSGVMGFAVGASFVAAYQIPLSQHETGTNPEPNSSDQNTKEKTDEALARYTWWLTVFTGGMALATVGLGIATVGLYSTGEKQIGVAFKAARAAELNAQAVIDAQRAHLFVIVVQHDVSETIQAGNQSRHDPSFKKISMHAPVLAYVFRNAGKTPAILEVVMHSMMIEKTEKHTITYEAPDRALEIILGESDLKDRIAVTFDERPFLLEDAEALGDHDLMLFFYSAATYRDIYNRKHKIRHNFLYSAGRFHLINRIEKTIEHEDQGAESEQTSHTGFFGYP